MAGENDDEKGKKQIFNTKYFICDFKIVFYFIA